MGDNEKCLLCGCTEETKLFFCSSCPENKKEKPVCRDCLLDPICEKMGIFDRENEEFTCSICMMIATKKQRDKFMSDFDAGTRENAVASLICAKYPWILTLKEATRIELKDALAKLKRFTTTTDEAVGELMINGNFTESIGATMMSWAAATGNEEQRLKNARSMEQLKLMRAPHYSYKKLLIPENGGSYETAMMFFAKVVQTSNDRIVIALAKERIFIGQEMKKKFTPYMKMEKKKESMPPKISRQGITEMYEMYRTLSREIKDVDRADTHDSMVFEQLYAPKMKYKLAKNTDFGKLGDISGVQDPWNANGKNGVQGKGGKKGKNKYNGETKDKNGGKNNQGTWQAQNTDDERLKKWNELYMKDDSMKNACKNCYIRTGKIAQGHTTLNCRDKGNACAMKCIKPECNGAKHWREDCPNWTGPPSKSAKRAAEGNTKGNKKGKHEK